MEVYFVALAFKTHLQVCSQISTWPFVFDKILYNLATVLLYFATCNYYNSFGFDKIAAPLLYFTRLRN